MTREEAEKLFAYEHLPSHLQDVSYPFYKLAIDLFIYVPEDTRGTYRDEALHLLWQAKNYAVLSAANLPAKHRHAD